MRARDPRTYDGLSLTGAARDEHGFENIVLAGAVDELRRLARPCAV